MTPRIANRMLVHLSSPTDPRGMLGAVPEVLPFSHVVWLRYVPSGYRGVRIVADVVYVFGRQRLPKGAKVLPCELTALAQSRWRGEHPCPRNPTHVRQLVQWYTAGADLVVEPFAGSGTTLYAARGRGIRAIGCEVDERWCEETAERLRAPWQPYGLDIEVRP